MSAWLIPWLGALPLRWIVSSLVAAGLFWTGYRLGQQGIQQAWDADRQQQQAAVLQQSLQVAQVQTRQEQINQRITTDHDTRKTQLQRLWQPQKISSIPAPAPPLSASALAAGQCTDAHSLREPAPSTYDPGPVPAYAEPAAGVDATASDALPDPARAQITVSCEQLASDAAQTTLMVLSFQRWYAEQTKAAGGDR
jgi:hypothetical protein